MYIYVYIYIYIHIHILYIVVSILFQRASLPSGRASGVPGRRAQGRILYCAGPTTDSARHGTVPTYAVLLLLLLIIIIIIIIIAILTCMYVCMYVCLSVCMHACMYACVYACMCVLLNARWRWIAVPCPHAWIGLADGLGTLPSSGAGWELAVY